MSSSTSCPDRRLRVLRLTAFFHHENPSGWPARYDPVGGMQTQIRRLTLWLADRDVEQLVFTLGFPGLPREMQIHPRVRVRMTRLPLPELPSEITGLWGLVPAWFLPALARVLTDARGSFRPDVVHVHADGEIYALLLAALTSLALPAPVVLTLHCSRLSVYQPLSWRDRLLHKAAQRCERWAIARSAAVVTLTERTAAVLARELAPSAPRVRVVPDAIDTSQFGDGVPADAVAQARRRWRLPAGRPLIAYVGRVAAEKGWMCLPQLATQLLDLDPFFLVVGDGPQRARLDETLAASGLAERFCVTGFVAAAEVAAALRLADVVVMPSKHEEFGGVALEAMASGVPVVGFAVGGLQDTVGSIAPENVVTPGDVAAMASRVRALLALRRPSSAAREYVHSQFHSDRVFPRVLGLYRELAG